MHFDHIVVHIDNDKTLLDKLKAEIEPLGFPFEPNKGKGTKGFKASNIWIGKQYFEIVRLLTEDGGGWTPHWVEKYRNSKRGVYCIFFATTEIDNIAAKIQNSGINTYGPMRFTYKLFWGLLKFSVPFRLVYLPPIPGTDLELGFIQYDPDQKDHAGRRMNPNAKENGIVGVKSLSINAPLNTAAIDFLKKVFGKSIKENELGFIFDNGGQLSFQDSATTSVQLMCEVTNQKYFGTKFKLLNITTTNSLIGRENEVE